jgi:hypothetical protein
MTNGQDEGNNQSKRGRKKMGGIRDSLRKPSNIIATLALLVSLAGFILTLFTVILPRAKVTVESCDYIWIFEDPTATSGFEAEIAMVQANIVNTGEKPTVLLEADLVARLDGDEVSLQSVRQNSPESNYFPIVVPSNGVVKTDYKWKAAHRTGWFVAADEDFKNKYDNRFSRFPKGTEYVVRYAFSNGYTFELAFDSKHQMKMLGKME